MSMEAIDGAEFRTIDIEPIDTLKRAKDLVGDQYLLFLGVTFVGILIGSLIWVVLGGPMMCGIYRCYLKKMRGEAVQFEDLFKGFDDFLESLIATLIVTAAACAVVIPLTFLLLIGVAFAAAAENVFVILFAYGLFLLATIALSAVVSTLFGFTYPLIVDRGLNAVPALQVSFRAARANLQGLLLFNLTIMGISVACAVCCYVPAILVAPFTLGAMAIIYREIFPAVAEAPSGAAPSEEAPREDAPSEEGPETESPD